VDPGHDLDQLALFRRDRPVQQRQQSVQGDYVEINRKIKAYSYFDLAANWKVREQLSLRAGMNNAFDKDPPVIAAGLLSSFGNGNTYPGVYDPMGRTLFVGLTMDF
jgi:iron complex outermembrane receptor protein